MVGQPHAQVEPIDQEREPDNHEDDARNHLSCPGLAMAFRPRLHASTIRPPGGPARGVSGEYRNPSGERRPLWIRPSGRDRLDGCLLQSRPMQHLRRIALLALVWGLLPHAATAGPLQDDLKARRSRAIERLGADTLAIFWSAATRRFSLDVDYEYRQDSNLLYLTGVDQEETILVLMPGNESRREILFIRDADPRREHWTGHSLTPAEATAQSGIATIMSTAAFEPFIAAMLSSRPMGGTPTEYAKFFDALSASRAKIAIALEPQTDLSSAPGAANQFAAKLRERFFGFAVMDATPIVAELRQIKTAYEQDVLRKSVLISSEAHQAGMKAAAPGRYRYRGRSRHRERLLA